MKLETTQVRFARLHGRSALSRRLFDEKQVETSRWRLFYFKKKKASGELQWHLTNSHFLLFLPPTETGFETSDVNRKKKTLIFSLRQWHVYYDYALCDIYVLEVYFQPVSYLLQRCQPFLSCMNSYYTVLNSYNLTHSPFTE